MISKQALSSSTLLEGQQGFHARLHCRTSSERVCRVPNAGSFLLGGGTGEDWLFSFSRADKGGIATVHKEHSEPLRRALEMAMARPVDDPESPLAHDDGCRNGSAQSTRFTGEASDSAAASECRTMQWKLEIHPHRVQSLVSTGFCF